MAEAGGPVDEGSQLAPDGDVALAVPGRDGFPAGLAHQPVVHHIAPASVDRTGHARLAASVPSVLWSLAGPIGRHLEASIIHDYLYMAWTDFRRVATKDDWRFADAVFLAGMTASRAPRRRLIHFAVHSFIGWSVFREKPYTLAERMEAWLPDLTHEEYPT